MSKVASLGHWAVAAIFAAKGIGLLREIVFFYARAWRSDTPLTYPDYVPVVLCAVYFVCVSGILQWQRWAHTSAIALSLGELAVFATLVVLDRSASLKTSIVWWPAINCAVLAWLVLPQVWPVYRQRHQTA